MSEKQNPERGAEQPSEEFPIPTLETPSPDSSPSGVDTEAIVKQVTEKLQRELRAAQSNKDREIAAIKKTLGIGDLSELEAMGATIPENVKLEYRLRQIESQRGQAEGSPASKTPSPGNGAALTAQDVSEVIRNYQLDANTPEVLEALRGTYRNRDHFEASMARMALARSNKPQPSAAASSALNAAASGAEIDVNALAAEQALLMKNPSKNMKRIQEIQETLKTA